MPNFSGIGAFTMLSQKVVTSLDIFSSDEIIIKLTKELRTISKSIVYKSGKIIFSFLLTLLSIFKMQN